MADTKGKKTKLKLKLDLKDPNVRNVLISVCVIGLAAYLWVEQVYIPKHESITELTAQKEKANTELARINALKPQLAELRKEDARLTATLDSLKNIFPDEKEVVKLIRQITTVNRRSNVVTTRFTPKPDVVQEYYVENKYDVSIAGDYHNIGEFFSSLANFQLIINLTNVAITANPSFARVRADDDGPEPERKPSVLASFELTTFSSRR